jgi:hypothetical protein
VRAGPQHAMFSDFLHASTLTRHAVRCATTQDEIRTCIA